MTSSSQDIAFLSMFGLTQRMKCVLVPSSVLTSWLSDVRNPSIRPTNFADLKRRTLPAIAVDCFSSKSVLTKSSSENCISTTRSCESGSLFFSRKPVVS